MVPGFLLSLSLSGRKDFSNPIGKITDDRIHTEFCHLTDRLDVIHRPGVHTDTATMQLLHCLLIQRQKERMVALITS